MGDGEKLHVSVSNRLVGRNVVLLEYCEHLCRFPPVVREVLLSNVGHLVSRHILYIPCIGLDSIGRIHSLINVSEKRPTIIDLIPGCPIIIVKFISSPTLKSFLAQRPVR